MIILSEKQMFATAVWMPDLKKIEKTDSKLYETIEEIINEKIIS